MGDWKFDSPLLFLFLFLTPDTGKGGFDLGDDGLLGGRGGGCMASIQNTDSTD